MGLEKTRVSDTSEPFKNGPDIAAAGRGIELDEPGSTLKPFRPSICEILKESVII